MNEKLNCPNCGAPITGARCEYCGTLFYDFANIEKGKESYLRMKIGDNLNIFKAVPETIKVEDTSENTFLYADNSLIAVHTAPEWLVTLELRVVGDDRGVLLEQIRKGANNV